MSDDIRAGNIALALCFAFYLAWWIVGFNPIRPIRGLRSAWLLIPAVVLGVLALIRICPALSLSGGPVPGFALIAAGIVSYVALLGITSGLLHRPVTSELFITALWATITFLEINTLVGLGSVSEAMGLILAALGLLCTVCSLVCYQLFYGLESAAAFVDGAIPLILGSIMTGLIAWCAR